jgi:D-alanyl-D-alanine carboxypeptidase/D-alanyl-D-alanine-endopeptidase (penicillin-binding protein 4)
MKKAFFITWFLLVSMVSFAQPVGEKLQKAFQKFENDPQLKATLSSLYVVNTKTGAVLINKNSDVGLAPGSTQKLITAAAAYELLGKDFRYKTEFGIVESSGETNLYIRPSCDPTLGSGSFENTKAVNVLSRISKAYRDNAKTVSHVYIENIGWNYETIPDGWVWQDIGNYFGAGADAINWRENQFDLILKSGTAIGDRVTVAGTEPRLYSYSISSLVTSAAKGSGDQSYIYFPLNSGEGIIRGSIPVNENNFKVSGALPDAKKQFAYELLDSLKTIRTQNADVLKIDKTTNFKLIHTETSPPFDSIVYWLNKKSINLYAEALVKTIGYQKANAGSTEKGLMLIKELWKSKGIDERELNILDGSGLSPSNRITTHAMVQVLQYAKKQSWFNGFYNSLPEFNDMKMKSGTIKDVKGFAGYHTSKAGVEYMFCFLVNNYNGATSSLVQKMYRVLDELK